jgi:hypothetical protein
MKAAARQPRQLGDVHSDAPGLVAGEELGRRAPSRLPLEVDVGERLPVGVADDEAGLLLVDRSGRGKRRAEGMWGQQSVKGRTSGHGWRRAS